MLRFIIRRLLIAIPTLFLIVTIAFFLIRIAPGGPFQSEKGLSPVIKANLERVYKLDRPLWEQYYYYLANVMKGDFGPSFTRDEFDVSELLLTGLPISMQLGATALTLALILGSAMGVLAALRQNKPADFSVIAVATAGSTVPTFVTAPVFQLVFALSLKWTPVAGWNDGALVNQIGPVLVLMLPQLAVVARLMRGSMIEALRAHHIRTARAMGLSEFSVVVRHAMRGAVMPILSYAGPAAAALLTGAIVTETIFGMPGVGRYFVESALNRDYTVVMGTVVMVAVFTIVFNLIVDVLYAVVDPRVRYD